MWIKFVYDKLTATPPRALLVSFGLAILAGTILLMMPWATASGEPAPFINVLFTATSAVCVTGLAVVDTGAYWSLFGQLVILVLIQIGGLGIMTMSTLFAFIMGRKISFRERLVLQDSLGKWSVAGIARLTKYALAVTFLLEGSGAFLLTLRFLEQYPPAKAIYLGVFHAVSAFNNAGFSLFPNSLEGYVSDPFVNAVVMSLIVLGGIGFFVILELVGWIRSKIMNEQHHRLSLHARFVLFVTGVLVASGALLILILEWNNRNTLGPLNWQTKLLAALFQAITPRTAGFNTIPIGNLNQATLLVIIILMFVGASPGGTGGGIKTTSFGTIVVLIKSIIRGDEETALFDRRLSRDITDRAVAIAFIALIILLIGTLALLTAEGTDLTKALFEVTSAFGTVGLSTGITPSLSIAGRLIIIVIMFLGRVGPLTAAYALAQRQRGRVVKHPEEKITVG